MASGCTSTSLHDTKEWKPTTYEIVNNLNGVSMTVKMGTVFSNELTVAFENNSNSEFIYGERFSLEKKINENWYGVPFLKNSNYIFPAIGYRLSPGETRELSVKWVPFYGSLDTGEYRIVKNIRRDTGDKFYLAAEFTITAVVQSYVIFLVAGAYVLYLVIKAFQIYIKKNS